MNNNYFNLLPEELILIIIEYIDIYRLSFNNKLNLSDYIKGFNLLSIRIEGLYYRYINGVKEGYINNFKQQTVNHFLNDYKFINMKQNFIRNVISNQHSNCYNLINLFEMFQILSFINDELVNICDYKNIIKFRTKVYILIADEHPFNGTRVNMIIYDKKYYHINYHKDENKKINLDIKMYNTWRTLIINNPYYCSNNDQKKINIVKMLFRDNGYDLLS